MKSLFDETCRYTRDASALEESVYPILHKAFKDYTAMGYSPREVFAIIANMASEIQCVFVLGVKGFDK